MFSNLSTPGEFIKDNEENLTINENRTGGEIPWCMLCSIGHAAKGVEAQLWLRMEERRREERGESLGSIFREHPQTTP